ncbi:MAG: aminopeptidase P family protein [Armatimonadetes bacterium]|nr:aminopeptidase P family protein [Armatimonadota bacterium]
MPGLISEKLDQAAALIAQSDLDVWLTFVRETFGGSDPVLPFLIQGGLTWQSALLVSQSGKKVAIVGNYDADAIVASGNWDEVVPYVQGLRDTLIAKLEELVPAGGKPRIGVNFCSDDVKADGLSHGMFLLLESYLKGTRFEGCLVSASNLVTTLRGVKTSTEIERMKGAIKETELLFDWVDKHARLDMSERDLYDGIQSLIESLGLGYAWDKVGDPIVNFGPDSMGGHGIPSDTIFLAPGQILHIDLGVTKNGYSSDIQSCWYVPHPGETEPPADAQRAFDAVIGAISAGAAVLKPGVQGWEVDAAARSYLVAQGFPEYLHALGHQVGRVAHDGGAILGPKWERYGRTPTIPIKEGEVYTLELGVFVEGRGYLGIEEMAQVTATGVEWLTSRQMDLPVLKL